MGLWHSDVYCNKCKREVGVTYSDDKISMKTGKYNLGIIVASIFIFLNIAWSVWSFLYAMWPIIFLPLSWFWIFVIFKCNKKKKSVDEAIYTTYCPICNSSILVNRDGKMIDFNPKVTSDTDALKKIDEENSKSKDNEK